MGLLRFHLVCSISFLACHKTNGKHPPNSVAPRRASGKQDEKGRGCSVQTQKQGLDGGGVSHCTYSGPIPKSSRSTFQKYLL